MSKIPNASIPALAMNETDLLDVLRNSLYPGAEDGSIKIVINYCKAAGLDPMQKPVHIVPMWDSKAGMMRDVIMPGIGLYRTQAARTKELAGISEPEFGPDITESIGGQEITYPAWCRVVVKRILPGGHIAEFAATERWKENYAVKGGKDKSIAPNTMWTKRPYAQIAKCAQAQALRIAFPEMTGSQPTAEEIEGREIDMGTINEVANPTRPELPAYTGDAMQADLVKIGKHIQSGKKTAEEIISIIKSKYSMTLAQEAEFHKLTPHPECAPVDADFVMDMESAEQGSQHENY